MMNDEQFRGKYVDVCIKQFEALEGPEGSATKANRYYHKKVELIQMAKDSDNIQVFIPLLDSENIIIRYNAATALIDYKPVQRRCVRILKEISGINRYPSFEAEMFLQEWRKGRLMKYPWGSLLQSHIQRMRTKRFWRTKKLSQRRFVCPGNGNNRGYSMWSGRSVLQCKIDYVINRGLRIPERGTIGSSLYNSETGSGKKIINESNEYEEKQKVAEVLSCFDEEVMNGGLYQFFTNSSREHAPYIADCLAAVGAAEVREEYLKFVKENQIDLNELSSFESESAEEFLEKYEQYPFEEFDDFYYALPAESTVSRLLEKYSAEAEDKDSTIEGCDKRMLMIDDFKEQMICFFPNIKEKLDEHISEYGEQLDTIVIEEIIMPEVIELLKRNKDKTKLKEVFDYFEEVSINSDDYLNNVFSITVLEILGNEKQVLDTAKEYMGPVTVKLQREADLAIGRRV